MRTNHAKHMRYLHYLETDTRGCTFFGRGCLRIVKSILSFGTWRQGWFSHANGFPQLSRHRFQLRKSTTKMAHQSLHKCWENYAQLSHLLLCKNNSNIFQQATHCIFSTLAYFACFPSPANYQYLSIPIPACRHDKYSHQLFTFRFSWWTSPTLQRNVVNIGEPWEIDDTLWDPLRP